jgi:hypothetical protein
MKERMQKTLSQVNGCPQRDRPETEWYGGVQTFMWMCEDNIVEVPFDKEHLFEQILSPSNLIRAYKAVMRNKGCGGIDKMSCEQLLTWLLPNKDELFRSLSNSLSMMLLNNGLSGPPWGVPSSLASNKPLFITPLRRYLCNWVGGKCYS